MSRPDNPTSGKYFLRSGKSSTTPVRSTFIQPHQSLSDATFNSPGPIICAPTPERHLHFFPRAEQSATSTSSSSSSSAGDDDTDSSATTDDDEMASTSNSLVPAPFTGRPTEDIHEFLKNFELWTLYRHLSDESSLSALPLLLKDGAAVWWNTQPDTIRGDMRALKAALIERYGIRRDEAWKRAAALWQLQQQPHQSTDDFLTHVNQEAQRLAVPPDQTFQVALNGLRPTIRQHVLQHDLRNVADIQKWARITESSQEDPKDTERTLRVLTAVTEELKKLQGNNLAALSAFTPRSRSPTPHRVSFSDPPTQPPVRQPPAADAYGPPSPRHSSFASQQQQPQYRGHARTPTAPPRQPPVDAYHRTTSSSTYQQQPYPRHTDVVWRSPPSYSHASCGNCGGKHGPQGHCRARGVTCYYCGIRGHLQSVCRAARGRFNAH